MSEIEIHEAHMTIDGVPLTKGQVMTIRVAVTEFVARIASEGLGDDQTGKDIAAGYVARGREVQTMLINSAKRRSEIPSGGPLDLDALERALRGAARRIPNVIEGSSTTILMDTPIIREANEFFPSVKQWRVRKVGDHWNVEALSLDASNRPPPFTQRETDAEGWTCVLRYNGPIAATISGEVLRVYA